jgi:hypothetical protein
MNVVAIASRERRCSQLLSVGPISSVFLSPLASTRGTAGGVGRGYRDDSSRDVGRSDLTE